MGVYGDGDNKKKKRGGMGTQPHRLAGLQRADRHYGNVDWGAAMPEMLAAVVMAVTRKGGAVSFGRTRDLGALLLTVFLDDSREKFYYNDEAEVDAELEKIVHYFDALPD